MQSPERPRLSDVHTGAEPQSGPPSSTDLQLLELLGFLLTG